jgi:hypothetical protein
MIVVLLLFVPLACCAQANPSQPAEFTVEKGAATEATVKTFQNATAFQSAQSHANPGTPTNGISAGLAAYGVLVEDIQMAESFFNEPMRTLQGNEILCREMWFGRAWACTAAHPKVAIATVVTQPMSDVYVYWFEKIGNDYGEFKRVCAQGSESDREFSKQVQQAINESSGHVSVWLKLKARFCGDNPSATYLDLDGKRKGCTAQ